MKKLLLVMLVPVLVLGVMGCGTKIFNGDASPIDLQGYWTAGSPDAVDLVISGNQITLLTSFANNIGNIALRTSYEGYKGGNNSGLFIEGIPSSVDSDFTLKFYWFDAPYDEIGNIKCKIDSRTGFTVYSVEYKQYYQNVMLPAAGVTYAKQ